MLRLLVQEVVQHVLETEMEEAVGAGKGERTANRVGYRSGYYSGSPHPPGSARIAQLRQLLIQTGADAVYSKNAIIQKSAMTWFVETLKDVVDAELADLRADMRARFVHISRLIELFSSSKYGSHM